MRSPAAGLLLLVLLAGSACDQAEFSALVVTGQVVRTLGPQSNSVTVLLGRAAVANIFRDDWMETPEPGDTTFWDYVFPARIVPLGGADVRLNNAVVPERLPGIYLDATLMLQYRQSYALAITTADGRSISARATLPDSFTLVEPLPGDSGGFVPLRVSWTRSDSAENYVVGVAPLDSGSTAVGWTGVVRETTCLVPAEAFADSLGAYQPGEYAVGVTAINGGWNRSGLDLFIAGGNVSGALGTFGCAVQPRPVVVRRFRQ